MVESVDLSSIFIDVVVSYCRLGSLINYGGALLLDDVLDRCKRIGERTYPERIVLGHVSRG